MIEKTIFHWDFREAGTDKWFPASVPGNIVSDLKTERKITDLFYGYNDLSVKYLETKDWEYRGRFFVDEKSASGNQRLILCFNGLDTYASVYLNENLILTSDNMFIGHEIDITSNLIYNQENELQIYFESPIKVEKKRLQQLGYLPLCLNEYAPKPERTRVFSRKAPFHYGWDWGPRFVTSGVWRPVELLVIDEIRLTDVYFKPVTINTKEARYHCICQVQSYTEKPNDIAIKLSINGKQVSTNKFEVNKGNNEVVVDLVIDNPELWWCNGYGQPFLYQIRVVAESENDKSEYAHQLGVRTLKLVQQPDADGHSFYFELNGIPVFAKGANYIPPNTLTTETTESDYQTVIDNAVNANMNMLRVWGGAIYEEDRFYELCAENGLMVWQDFMFACDMMPPEEYILDSIKQEAVYNVKRLRNHACLALWCGNNENLMGWGTWWKDKFPESQHNAMLEAYKKIFHEILPSAVQNNHPEIAYWPSSPASYPGDKYTSRSSGDEHDWSVWFMSEPIEHYYTDMPRFVSEYGIQAYPEWDTLLSFAEESELKYKSPLLDHRQRSPMEQFGEGYNGNDHIRHYCDAYLHQPCNFEGHVYYSQVFQTLALKTAIEAHRSHKPYCMGSLYWQINDCWPTISWSTVDYFGRWKPAHYAVKKAFEPVILALQWQDGVLQLYVVSDLPDDFNGNVELYSFSVHAKQQIQKIAETEVLVQGSKAGKRQVPEINNDKQSGIYAVLKNKNGKVMATNTILPDKLKNLEIECNPKIQLETRATTENVKITILSDVFVKSFGLKSNVEGHFPENYIDLLPGVKHEIEFYPIGNNNHGIDFRWDTYNGFIKR